MDLDAVDAGLLHTHGSVAKLVRELMDLINRDGTRRLASIGRAHKGRSDQTRRARDIKGHVGGVEELRHDLAAILVHGGGELFPTGNECVVVAAHVARQVGIGGLDRHDLGDDQTHAALGAGAIVVDQVVGHIAVVGQVSGYRRHKDAVLNLGRTNLDGAKEHRIGGGLHTGFLSFEPHGGTCRLPYRISTRPAHSRTHSPTFCSTHKKVAVEYGAIEAFISQNSPYFTATDKGGIG